MNNQTHFKREFMLTVERIGTPRAVYVADVYGFRFPVPIPVFGGVSISEQDFVDKIVKEKGEGTITALMLEIANKIAPLNGGDPNKILTGLIKYQRGGGQWKHYIEDYEPYFLNHAKDEYERLVAGVEGQRLIKMGQAAQAHALLNRVPDLEERHGRKWKTEDALDPKIMSSGVLLQFSNLYQIELGMMNLAEHVNEKDEFTWRPKPNTPVVKEEETAEALAGK